MRIHWLLLAILSIALMINGCQVSENVASRGNSEALSLALEVNSDWSHLIGGGHNFILREARKDSVTDSLAKYVVSKAKEWLLKNEGFQQDTTKTISLDSIIKFTGNSKAGSAVKLFEVGTQTFKIPLDSLPPEWNQAVNDFTSAMDKGSTALHQYITDFETDDNVLEQLLLSGTAIYDSSSAFWNGSNVPDIAPLITCDAVFALIGGIGSAGDQYIDGGWDNIDWWRVAWWALVSGAGASFGVSLGG